MSDSPSRRDGWQTAARLELLDARPGLAARVRVILTCYGAFRSRLAIAIAVWAQCGADGVVRSPRSVRRRGLT